MKQQQVALIVGAGPGLGFALGRRFARAEMNVALAARSRERTEDLAAECCGIGHAARAYRCDATEERDVLALFEQVGAELGDPQLVVCNTGAFVRRSVLDTTVEEFERCWRAGCLAGFLVAREAARRMIARRARGAEGGTIIFTGATASLRGSAAFQNLAVGKFGLRALAQSMARELQPQGIHVAHVVIDGRIRSVADEGDDSLIDPGAIAEVYYQLHMQPANAWTLELDVRPSVEKF